MTFTFHFTDSLIVVHRLTFSITCEILGFPGGSSGKESACNAGDTGDMGQEDSLEEGMVTHSSILPGESYGQRSLTGYNPYSHRELDMTEVTQHACMWDLGSPTRD